MQSLFNTHDFLKNFDKVFFLTIFISFFSTLNNYASSVKYSSTLY